MIVGPTIGNMHRAEAIKSPDTSNIKAFQKEKEKYLEEKKELEERIDSLEKENKELKRQNELMETKIKAFNTTNVSSKGSVNKRGKGGD